MLKKAVNDATFAEYSKLLDDTGNEAIKNGLTPEILEAYWPLMIKIFVFDTNVLISANLSPGQSTERHMTKRVRLESPFILMPL